MEYPLFVRPLEQVGYIYDVTESFAMQGSLPSHASQNGTRSTTMTVRTLKLFRLQLVCIRSVWNEFVIIYFLPLA